VATDVSIVIATWNRARLLEGALEALVRQQAPATLRFEILVVDNNSSDSTPEVVRSASTGAAVPIRYIFEPRQGLSHARNRGVREAHGKILAFTDDDVLPEPDWVSQVAAAMARWRAHGIGGRILPRWESPPPGWITENRHLLNRLALMDSQESRLLSLPLPPRPQIWGANMAFRRELFEAVGNFDPRRGVVGRSLSRGEEIDVIRRALQKGFRIAYDPALVVLHRIGSDRMRRSYFRRLIFEDAQARAQLDTRPSDRTFFGAPLRSYRAALKGLPRWLGLVLLGRARAFDAQLDWLDAVGRLSGYWKGLGDSSSRPPRSEIAEP
jgi:GT2 family glycosyltransferase